ncbi:hypothetical protein Tco_1523425 [Tanacetum coccineum]
MTPTQALTAIQTMADHSQKLHDGTSNRNVSSNSNTDGLAAIVSKLDNLGRDMKKLKENVHAIQVGCQICEGPHLDKECPLNEEVKQLEEVKYGEFGRSAPFNRSNGAKFRVGNDRIMFDMEKKYPNFMIPTEKILTMSSISNNEPSCPPGNPSSKSLKTDNLQDRQEQQVKKKLRLDEYILVKHFGKPIMQTYNGKVFDLEIEQLANEYELGIGKKGQILDMIWENRKNIHGKAKEWWYDYWLEEDEKQENGDKKYDPLMVHMETFEITRYSFDNGNSFICVIGEIKDTLSLGRENGSRFRKMIRQEMNQREDTHDKT